MRDRAATMRPLLWAAVLALSAAARAAGPQAAMEEARKTTESGQPQKAVEALRAAQVDHPESAELQYALGAALYAQAAAQPPEKGAETGDLFAEAGRAFAAAESAAAPDLKEQAAFGKAAAAARAALSKPGDPEHYQDAVAALRGAVQGFEGFIAAHPGHEGARTNLDHLRLKLKELLQNPPEKQDGDKQQPPPQNQEQQPRTFFLNVDTQWPNAHVESEGNAARLVIPDGKGGGPK